MIPAMGDVLSGSSLIVAILVAFYTIWQADIAAAKSIKVSPTAGDQPASDKRKVRAVLVGRVVPLLAVALATFAILIPRTLRILFGVAACWNRTAPSRACYYDDTGALLVFTELLLFGLVFALSREALSLRAKISELS